MSNNFVRFDNGGPATDGAADQHAKARAPKQKNVGKAESVADATTSSAAHRVVFQETVAATPKQAAPTMALGRGLDVGTANLLSVRQNAHGDLSILRERNAFLEVPSQFVGNREMLT